ncbi:MAG: hypothetical protein V4621_05395 [Pseudomonadota bacterium]
MSTETLGKSFADAVIAEKPLPVTIRCNRGLNSIIAPVIVHCVPQDYLSDSENCYYADPNVVQKAVYNFLSGIDAQSATSNIINYAINSAFGNEAREFIRFRAQTNATNLHVPWLRIHNEDKMLQQLPCGIEDIGIALKTAGALYEATLKPEFSQQERDSVLRLLEDYGYKVEDIIPKPSFWRRIFG